MLKLSILLSKLDFSTMGDLRADLVGEAERLEGVEEVREVIKKECEKADTAPVALDNVQLDCEIEWAIYGTVGKTWLFPLHADGYTWGEMVRYAKRFSSKEIAQAYIAINHIAAAIPFPVPKIKEAK